MAPRSNLELYQERGATLLEVSHQGSVQRRGAPESGLQLWGLLQHQPNLVAAEEIPKAVALLLEDYPPS